MNALSTVTRLASFAAACTITACMFLSVNTLAQVEASPQLAAHGTAASANV